MNGAYWATITLLELPQEIIDDNVATSLTFVLGC